MNHNQLLINEFSLDNIVKNKHILMIAERASGKTTMIKNIIDHIISSKDNLNNLDISICSPTERVYPFYRKCLTGAHIVYECTNDFAKQILVEGSKNIQEKNLKEKIVVLEDCFSGKKSWTKDENVMELLMNARDYNITLIVSAQTTLGITTDLRFNFDYYFLFNQHSTINKNKLWKDYVGMFPDFNAFEKVFTKCTEHYRCMVIDNKKQTSNINEKLYWYKAKYIEIKEDSEDESYNKLFQPLIATKCPNYEIDDRSDCEENVTPYNMYNDQQWLSDKSNISINYSVL